VDRYGSSIEADLHREYGIDLVDFFRGRYSWRKLLNLIQQLPSWALTTEAMANDDELADMASEKPSSDVGPRVSEYTPEVARLDMILDRVSELIAVSVQVAGGKAPRTRPARRPETAYSRAEKRRTERRMGALIAEVEAAQQRASSA